MDQNIIFKMNHGNQKIEIYRRHHYRFGEHTKKILLTGMVLHDFFWGDVKKSLLYQWRGHHQTKETISSKTIEYLELLTSPWETQSL